MKQIAQIQSIGLFGGSFDPPHLCHLLISLYVQRCLGIEEVWWVPCARHAFGKRAASFEHRVAMCERAVQGVSGLSVSSIERSFEGPSYTIDTLNALQEQHPELHFRWIVGSDLLGELPRWQRWPELAERLEFIVVERGPAGRDVPPEGHFHRLPLPFPDLSSTTVRGALAAGESVRGLVDDAVRSYLDEHTEFYGVESDGL